MINDSVEKIQARIRAFATNNKGAFFCIGDEKYRCRDMDILMNDYLYSKFRQEDDISIILKYECYVLVKKGVKTIALDTAQKSGLLQKTIKIIKNMDLTNLILVIAIPFTPAFLINIAAAIANIDKKKFIISILIGKIFMVYFWGFIGVSLIESLKNPLIIIRVSILLIFAYILSIIAKKILKIN